MFLEKPSLVRHSNAAGRDCAIYGIDAHPTEPKFATAGGDNCVKIWSMTSSPDQEGPVYELLATLAWHEQAVNCVRWSHSGKYLASGSDDHSVLIYELQEGAPSAVPFGSNREPNKEKWVRCAMLKNHTMDVQDVAWSPDDRMLATCSIDNSILIWSMDQLSAVMTHPIQHLTGHNGWVKGVAWDPVGKYLTSAGEDKSVIVWRVDTWEIEAKIEAPFEHCASTSHFRRLSWAPDGSLLCATHAHISKQDVGAFIQRKSWANDVNLVGHRGVVTSARFNPRLFAKTANQEFACCALGGDDCTVTIWLAHVARPLVAVTECFDASVTDLSWSHDGFTLLCASLDGAVCVFQLTADELGTPMTPQEQSRLLQQKYGSLAGRTSGSTLIEDPLQLELEARQKQAAPTQLDRLAMRLTPLGASNATLDAPSTEAAPTVFAPAPTVFTLTARPKAKPSDAPTPANTPVSMLVPRPKHKDAVTTLVARPKALKKPETSSKEADDDDNAPIIKRKRTLETTPKPRAHANTLLVVDADDRDDVFPELASRALFTHTIALPRGTSRVLECRLGDDYSSITCTDAGTCQWMDRLPGVVVRMVGNEAFCAFGTTDGSLYVLSASGRRLFPCIALGHALAALEVSPHTSPYLLAILRNGDVKTWNVLTPRAAVNTTLRSVATVKSTLIRSHVTTTGQPIVTMALTGAERSRLHSFTFDLAMLCW
ncbi:hypothetical protein SPRG_04130 [Saprolegnia parasitica CBS 223.65]|uniref:Protein HIRA n=1 Tax=Saprolegnia parasitica (strain CBS 223.65) TaxID=695850 RepID=A0A067CVW1_SAPPC|nr:hypothetical protein SPRG_04130 [Saprolegnia parasitica CBS 223.65]KDO30942.1 hypothetical protein SPRG_04130 [Saprolegnia parasitica CBS 223.65]|eukprot:XP_012198126.1 hypothetical protein SPRG_04130 [Saprolegnia parasitica CBS 223.65]